MLDLGNWSSIGIIFYTHRRIPFSYKDSFSFDYSVYCKQTFLEIGFRYEKESNNRVVFQADVVA